jgi:hypothetical protein
MSWTGLFSTTKRKERKKERNRVSPYQILYTIRRKWKECIEGMGSETIPSHVWCSYENGF